MDNLIFSINATLPIFLLMVVGYFIKQIHWIDEEFANKLNSFVFKLSLPCMIFHDLAVVNFSEAWNTKFVLFCFAVTIISILLVFGISTLLKNPDQRGEFIQVSYRSSAAILGIAFIQNIYGNAGMGPMMIIGSVPLYNICAVLVLSFFSPKNREKRINQAMVKKTLIGIAKNPIIIGIILGLICSAIEIPIPAVLIKTVDKIGSTASPLGLIAMGACFDLKKAMASRGPAIVASFIKLVGFGLVFVPLAILCGYEKQELVAILVMLCSASTVTCYVMAKNMGYEGTLTSATVMLTTLLAAVTLTIWLTVLRTFGLV